MRVGEHQWQVGSHTCVLKHDIKTCDVLGTARHAFQLAHSLPLVASTPDANSREAVGARAGELKRTSRRELRRAPDILVLYVCFDVVE
jgi:hypothetical protein